MPRRKWGAVHLSACVTFAMLTLSWTSAGIAQTPSTFEVNQKVEVREGDTWSPATVVKKEGRRYQIKYDDGTEEWVGADRLRVPAAKVPGAPPAPAPAPAGGAKPPADQPAEKPADKPAAPAVRAFTKGQKVQAKWGGTWWDATIERRHNDWYFVTYSDRTKEWVQHWRVRQPGEAYDIRRGTPTGKNDIDKPPTESAGSNPDEPKGAGKPPANQPGATPESTRGTAPPAASSMVEPDRTGAKAVLPALTGDTWEYKPAEAALPKLHKAPIAIDTTGSANETHLLISGTTAGVIRSSPSGSGLLTRLQIIDLLTGKPSWLGELAVNSRVLAISPDGKHAVTRSSQYSYGQRIDIWKLEGDKATALFAFAPYAKMTGHRGKDVEWAAFADGSTLLTSNSNGIVMCWDVTKPALKWEIDPEVSARFANVLPALSADGKVLALKSELGLLLLQTTDGTVAASIPQTNIAGALSFSADGKRLAAASNGVVQTFDLTTGKASPLMGLPKGLSAKSGTRCATTSSGSTASCSI